MDEEKIKRSFGKTLKRLREDRRLSQEELGYESGYHRTYISQIERGEKNPSIQTVFELARALNMKPRELVRAVENQLAK